MKKNKHKGSGYAPRANYEWVPAIATVVFILSFVLLTFAPLFSAQPESVINWLAEMKSDIILFVGLCLGFFLKVPVSAVNDETKDKG